MILLLAAKSERRSGLSLFPGLRASRDRVFLNYPSSRMFEYPDWVLIKIERHQIESHKSRDLPDDLAGNGLQGVVPQRFLIPR
jgi:hypothetical protein